MARFNVPPPITEDDLLEHAREVHRLLIGLAPDDTGILDDENVVTSSLDHGELSGLADDDHPQYGEIAETEIITGDWTFNPNGDGGLTSYDIKIGDTDGTPTYGMIQIGNAAIGRTSYAVGNIDLDGAILYRNIGGPVTGQIEHIFTESTGGTCRFAIPKSGVGNATYNPRSMLIAGPAPADTDFVTVGYWQTNNNIFDNLACDTTGTGADLGVQNDLEVEGDIFTDSIKESTTGAGISLNNTTNAQHVLPSSDDTYDLGSESFQWQDIHISDAVRIKGALCISSKVNEAGGISIGDVVYISGATGDKPQVSLANNTVHDKAHIFGMAGETKADGENIWITISGEVRGVNTNGLGAGNRLHLTTAGQWQVAVPTNGAHVHVGFVSKDNVSTGIIEVVVEQYVHDIRGVDDQQVEISCGDDDATGYIDFQDYSRNSLMRLLGTGNLGINQSSPTAMLHIVPTSTTEEGLIIQETASQSANDLEIQDNSGNVLISAIPGTDIKWRVHSGDSGEANDYIEMYHNQTDGVLEAKNGHMRILTQAGGLLKIFGMDSNSGFQLTNANGQVGVHFAFFDNIAQANLSVADRAGNQLIITNQSNAFVNHDHATQTDPTLYVHSDLSAAVSNNQWGSLHHDQEDFIITTGANTGAGSSPTTDNNAIVFSPRGAETARTTSTLFQMGDDKLIAVDVNSGLTASTTQSQGQGALTAQVNEISTVANKDDTVTLPSAVTGIEIEIINNGANTLQIFPASGDDLGLGVDVAEELEANERVKFVAYTTTNWAKESTTEIIHAEIHDEDNTDAFVINDAGGDFHSYHTNGLAAGDLADWAFDAGGAGTSFPIASIADGVDSGVDIEVTTTGSHGLATGDIVSQTNLADPAYVGVFVVKAIISATQYEVAAVYTATGTGTLDQAATLEADAVAAGVYSFAYYITGTLVGNNETFDFQLYKEATAVTGSKVRRKFGAANDFGSMSGGGVVSVANGDKISLALSNEDSAANIILRNLTIVLIRL